MIYSHILLNERNSKIGGLEANNRSLGEAKAILIEEMAILKRKVSAIEPDLKVRNEELRLERIANGSNDKKIQKLEASKSVFIETQEKDKAERMNLQATLQKAKSRLDYNEAELELYGKRLMSADQVKEQLRQKLELVTLELSTEKSTNRTVSLEQSLATANSTIDTLSTDLSDATVRLEEESERNNSLANAMNNGRVFQGRLAGDPVLVQIVRFREERKALVIIDNGPHGRILWNGSLDRCRIKMKDWIWYLHLDGGSDWGTEGIKEMRVTLVDTGDLEEWARMI